MIVGDLRAEALGATVVRSARVGRDGREDHVLRVAVPSELAPEHADDATGLLPLCVLLAMRHGEPLEVEGRAEADLLPRLDALQRLYRAMDPSLTTTDVRVRGVLPRSEAPAPFAGCCFSRGVDSMHAAALGRSPAGPIDALVHVDALEPGHDAEARAGERRLAADAASLLGLPLIVAEAAIRELTDGILDWADALAAGMALVGHSLSGGLGRLVIPSGDPVLALGPTGSSPAVDPLTGSRALAVEHGEVALTRAGKVAWLAEHRPDLLGLLKVCLDPAAGAGNCGRCGKCLETMAALRAAGVLEQATSFPELDLELLAASPRPHVDERVHVADARERAARAGDAELVAVLDRVLLRTARSGAVARWGTDPASFRRLGTNVVITLLRDGRADSDAGRASTFPHRGPGLLAAFDRRGRRYTYAAGAWALGEPVAELGALCLEGTKAQIPLWIGPDGSVGTDRYTPPSPRPSAPARLAHALAPLRRGAPRRALRRAIDLAAAPPRERAPHISGDPAGYLHEEGGDGRVALWSGVHPVTGDQLLATEESGIVAAGYRWPVRLGHLEAAAPVTGRLGVVRRPTIPWSD